MALPKFSGDWDVSKRPFNHMHWEPDLPKRGYCSVSTHPSPPHIIPCPLSSLSRMAGNQGKIRKLPGVCVSIIEGTPLATKMMPSWASVPLTPSATETHWPIPLKNVLSLHLFIPSCLSYSPITEAHINVWRWLWGRSLVGAHVSKRRLENCFPGQCLTILVGKGVGHLL